MLRKMWKLNRSPFSERDDERSVLSIWRWSLLSRNTRDLTSYKSVPTNTQYDPEYFRFTTNTYRNPRVLHNLINGQTIGWINTQHSFDEYLGAVTNILPFRIRKVILSSSDAFLHTRWYGQSMIAIKRWKATQSKQERNFWITFRA